MAAYPTLPSGVQAQMIKIVNGSRLGSGGPSRLASKGKGKSLMRLTRPNAETGILTVALSHIVSDQFIRSIL
jgi:hypothetical protein